jgi:quinol monooxygenase YgiN
MIQSTNDEVQMAIIRIVRMHFTQEGSHTFLQIFEENKQAIRNFPGCTYLELLKDVNDPLIYTTLSHWQDNRLLEDYRKSDLFKNVWSRVKPLFSKQPEAFSLITYIEV